MFEQRKKTWNYSWVGIIGVVIIIIAIVQIFKVNPPDRAGGAAQLKPSWTEGKVFDGSAEVPAGGYLPHRLDLNRRATFKGFFTTGRNDRRVAGTLIKAEDFNMWKLGEDVDPMLSTGPVPRGTINRVLESGSYLFLIDNRGGEVPVTLAVLDVGVE
jgi:hypothetical protein